MANLNWDEVERDDLRFAAELDQHKANAREMIAEMGEEWLMAIMEVCDKIDNDNCRPPLPALASFAKIGIMATVADVCDDEGL